MTWNTGEKNETGTPISILRGVYSPGDQENAIHGNVSGLKNIRHL